MPITQDPELHLKQAGSVDGDKKLAAPGGTRLHGGFPLLQAVLSHDSGEDLGPLLKGYEKGCMPAHACMPMRSLKWYDIDHMVFVSEPASQPIVYAISKQQPSQSAGMLTDSWNKLRTLCFSASEHLAAET